MDFSHQQIILRKPLASPATATTATDTFGTTIQCQSPSTSTPSSRTSSLANLRALADAQQLRANRLSRAKSAYWNARDMSAVDEEGESGLVGSTHTPENAPAELSAVVDELLNGLSAKFTSVSAEILTKIDDMSRRLDNLEATIQSSGEGGSTNSK